MQIALGLDLQVEKSMARETFEHVIEERNPGLCLAAPCAVELERDLDRSLARLALDFARCASPWPAPAARLSRAVLVSISQAGFAFALHFDSCRRALAIRRAASKFHRARMTLEPFHPRQMRDRRSERRNRALDASIILVRFRKSYAPRGEAKRAAPPVGSTWLGPAR